MLKAATYMRSRKDQGEIHAGGSDFRIIRLAISPSVALASCSGLVYPAPASARRAGLDNPAGREVVGSWAGIGGGEAAGALPPEKQPKRAVRKLLDRCRREGKLDLHAWNLENHRCGRKPLESQ